MSRRKILIPVIAFIVLAIVLAIVLNTSFKYKSISITESKWNDIIKSRTENRNLVLMEISFNDYRLIIDEKNSNVYYSVINESPNKYNPNVNYAINTNNAKLAFLSDEITEEKTKGNYQFKIIIYNEKEYHIYNLICTSYPLLNISYNKDGEIQHKNTQMEMYLFDNLSNIPNKVTISSGKIKSNENGYVFSLHMLTPGKNKRENRVSILGMKPNDEYRLEKVDEESDDIQKNNESTNKKENRVELFINNEYKGLYKIW